MWHCYSLTILSNCLPMIACLFTREVRRRLTKAIQRLIVDQNSPDILSDLNSGENWLMNVNMSKKVRYVGYIKKHIS